MTEVFDFLSSIFEHNGDFVCLASLQAEPIFVNPVGRRWLGMDEHQDVSATKLSE